MRFTQSPIFTYSHKTFTIVTRLHILRGNKSNGLDIFYNQIFRLHAEIAPTKLMSVGTK